jgi:hypothetical protein
VLGTVVNAVDEEDGSDYYGYGGYGYGYGYGYGAGYGNEESDDALTDADEAATGVLPFERAESRPLSAEDIDLNPRRAA